MIKKIRNHSKINKPIAPKSPFFQWKSDNWEFYKNQNNPSTPISQLTSIMIKDFTNLPQSKLKYYHDIYEQQKQIYEQQMEKWKQNYNDDIKNEYKELIEKQNKQIKNKPVKNMISQNDDFVQQSFYSQGPSGQQSAKDIKTILQKEYDQLQVDLQTLPKNIKNKLKIYVYNVEKNKYEFQSNIKKPNMHQQEQTLLQFNEIIKSIY
ncbi:High mobility group box domain [Pseudocohnilembus persalinus]|uniref:High mobility group box domain n=1 Tax=Pseudocohnilembus persalinus TaxID=266149 RepID=A0A0V0QXD5_PSEPJ|nr:High mobility group box domain [Pseudocohnilembus persalinus]|eukprot:KRX06991.1 High mobility group box domain [Pseudocohnilembus persalinus]